MRYIILTISSILLLVHTVTGQKDFQIEVDTPYNRLQVLLGDTSSASATYGLASWELVDSVKGAFADQDWYKLGGTAIPTNSDSAYRSGYTLFKGLYGGLATKIEMLKDGVLQFDIADGITDQNFIRFKPLQDGTRNVDFLMSTTTTPFSGSRNDNVFYWGWNLGAGGGVVESGKGAIGISMEDFYNPSGTNAYSEFHLIHYDTLGNSRRPMTFLLDVGSTSTWAMALSLAEIKYTLATDVTKIGFDFTMPSGNLALFKLLNPQTGLGVEMQVNDASNEFQITNTMGGGSEIYLNSFTYCETNILRRAASFGSTATTIAGNDGSGWFTNVGTGWGIDLTSGNLVVDSSQVATQYDLTTIGTPTFTVSDGVNSENLINQTMTVSGAGGIVANYSPVSNTLEIDGFGVSNQSITNTSDATSHTVTLFDAAGDPIQSVKLSEGTGITLTTTGTADDGIVTIATTITDTDTRTTIEEDDSTVESNAVTLNFSTGLDAQESPSTQVNVNLDFGEFPQDATMEGDEEVLVWDTGASIEERVPVAQFDQSTTNEIQTLDVSGTGPTITFDLSSDVSDPTITGAGITAITASGNAITVTSTEVDGSTTNEAWTIDADLGDTEVISNQTVLMSGDSGIVTTYTASTNTWTADIRGDEFTTVTTPESTDYLLMHDENGSSADVIEKILWSDITMDIISFYDGTVLQGTGNAIDVGEGIDINMAGNEANINLDASEFLLDGTNETDESFLVYDPDTTAGHRIQRIPWSDVVGGSDTNFAEDNLTWTGNRTHNESTYTTTIQGSAMAWKFEDIDATAGPSITLEGNIGNSDAPFGSIAFQYSDSGFATDQAAWTMVANRETNDQEHSTLEITANEATAAPPVIVFEENQNLSDNTQETFIQLNGGIAKTQYWESATSNAITLDRGYYNVALLSGHTGTITLPEIYGINEANTEVSATLVPIGQEYVITNLSGSSVTIAAINNTGTANDDWLNNTEAGTYSLANGNSIIVKATTIVSNEGHWFIY